MKAAQLVAPRSFRLLDCPTPEPRPGHVVFQIEGCGICGSNIPPWRGIDGMPYPLEPGHPGHEAWGVVRERGAGVTNLEIGQRIAALSYHAFGELDAAHADAVVPLPRALDGRAVPGEPIACAVNVAHRSGVREGDTVVVLGIGFLGALLLPLLRARGAAHIIAASRRPLAHALAAARGADDTVTLDALPALVADRTKQAGADVVIEATGAQEALDVAGTLCRVRGRLIIAGYHQGGRRSIDLQLWNWRGLDVINAHERDPRVYLAGMREGIQAVTDGLLDVDALITHFVPLPEIGRGFELAERRPADFFKAVVVPVSG